MKSKMSEQQVNTLLTVYSKGNRNRVRHIITHALKHIWADILRLDTHQWKFGDTLRRLILDGQRAEFKMTIDLLATYQYPFTYSETLLLLGFNMQWQDPMEAPDPDTMINIQDIRDTKLLNSKVPAIKDKIQMAYGVPSRGTAPREAKESKLLKFDEEPGRFNFKLLIPKTVYENKEIQRISWKWKQTINQVIDQIKELRKKWGNIRSVRVNEIMPELIKISDLRERMKVRLAQCAPKDLKKFHTIIIENNIGIPYILSQNSAHLIVCDLRPPKGFFLNAKWRKFNQLWYAATDDLANTAKTCGSYINQYNMYPFIGRLVQYRKTRYGAVLTSLVDQLFRKQLILLNDQGQVKINGGTTNIGKPPKVPDYSLGYISLTKDEEDKTEPSKKKKNKLKIPEGMDIDEDTWNKFFFGKRSFG